MLIYDDIFKWNGWGGVFKLASGNCHLRIFDFNQTGKNKLTMLKPIIVVVSETTEASPTMKNISIRSCIAHIATGVTQQFQIDPNRMIFVEYCPQQVYGQNQEHVIAARFDAVDFQWHSGKALHPQWRSLPPALVQTLGQLIHED
jgi:hypothetical protein